MRVLSPLVVAALMAFPTSGAAQDVIVRSSDLKGIAPLEFSLDAQSTQKYAFVVGIGDYEAVPDLPNAVSDAKLVSSMLREGGYTVADYYDIGKEEFEAALRRMLFDVETGAELVFFFAGHGVQIGSQNYLLPSDTVVKDVYDIPFATVSLSSLMSLGSARARSLVMILDACRDNPFPGKDGIVELEGTPASLRSGFSAQDAPINSLVIFSTAPGAVALDGDGENSPFTKALVDKALSEPAIALNDMLKDIRREVYVSTGRRQVPWESSSLIEPVYLTRSLAQTSPREALASDTNVTNIEVRSPLHRTVPMGKTLTQQFGLPADGGVAVLSQPSAGRIETLDNGVAEGLQRDETRVNAQAGNLVYRPYGKEQRAVSMPSSGQTINDSFQIAVANEVKDVSINLNVDPCDFQAGDHLDPEGVGITRFPNEIEPFEALRACEAAVSREPENGRFHYQLGRVQLALRDVDEARTSFDTAARLGHTRAIHGLGTIEVAKVAQTAGNQSGRAPDSAMEFYARGVDRGDPYAYHSLGLNFLRHPVARDDPRQGFELLSRSLELGHTFSMNALGLYFLDEKAPHYDAERGLRYLRESAARGDIYGYANMGFVYARGIGGEAKNPARALELFMKASDGGHPTAPSSIGRMYNAGDLPGGRNMVRAIEFYDLALSRGDAWGGANAAWIIANRTPAGFTPFDAAVRAAKAAALRNPEPAKNARETLGNLSERAISGGMQQMMNDLGVAIPVDGAFGPQSERALADLAEREGVRFGGDRRSQLMDLARLYWTKSKFRVDLY